MKHACIDCSIIVYSLCTHTQVRAIRTDADPPHLHESASAAAAAREARMRAAERGITLAQQQAQDRVGVVQGLDNCNVLIFISDTHCLIQTSI